MALDFPNSPSVGQIFPPTGSPQWQWDGTKWVSYGLGGGATITVSDSPPGAPTAGTLWFDSIGAQLYLWENDGTSTQWVPVVNQGGALTIAAASNVGRNLLHNPLFNIQQRGVGPWAPAVGALVYTADRWFPYAITAGDTINQQIAAQTDANRGQIGDEAAQWLLSSNFIGGSGASNGITFSQRIENVRRLAGKTITVSFWANASAALKLGVGLQQFFGVGGSPSPPAGPAAQSVTLSTSWQRYSATFVMPSVAGMTFGTTAGTDFTVLQFWLSAGANNAIASGNVGVQSGTINLWGVQLEIGSVATPLERPDPQQDLAECQRFYQTGIVSYSGYNAAGAGIGSQVPFANTMRANPVIALSGQAYINASGAAVSNISVQSASFTALVTAASAAVWSANYTASADL